MIIYIESYKLISRILYLKIHLNFSLIFFSIKVLFYDEIEVIEFLNYNNTKEFFEVTGARMIQVIINASLGKYWIYFLYLIMLGYGNLIQDGDFEGFVLSIDMGGNFIGRLDVFNYFECYTWYRSPDNLIDFQITNYLNTTNQGLDTLKGAQDATICQNVTLQINKTYIVQYDYLIDYPEPKNIKVTFNEAEIFSAKVSTTQANTFSTVTRASDTVGTLCFYGIYDPSAIQFTRGVIIDNVNVTEAVVTENIVFVAMSNWKTKKLTLSSNFIVDPTKINAFNGTIVMIGEVLSPLLELYVGESSNIQLVTDLNISLDSSALTISVYIPDYTYTNNDGYGTKFIIINASDQVLELQALPENVTDSQESTSQSELIDIFPKILESLRIAGIIGFAALIFKFLSFANIYILYLFLNIRYLDPEIRQSLERFAQVLLGKGLISTFSQLVLEEQIDLTLFKIQTVQKLPTDVTTNGSLFSVINISANLFETCFEDLLVMIGNCLMIIVLYQFVLRINNCRLIQKKISSLQTRSFINLLLIQVVSVSPTWTLSISLVLNQSHFASEDFITKLNSAIFVTFPVFLLMSWFPIHLNYFAMKKINGINKLVQKKDNTNLLEKDNHQEIKEILSSFSLDLTIKSLKYHKTQNTTIKKQPKAKKVYLSNSLQRMESLNSLFFIIFGSIIGMQNLGLFFSFVTIYKIVFICLLWKSRQISFDYLLSVLDTLIKVFIHSSFLALFILTELSKSQLINDIFGLERGKQLSQLILYSFLFGCLFQAFTVIVNLFRFIFQVIKAFQEIAINNSAEKNLQQANNADSNKMKPTKLFPQALSSKTRKVHELVKVQQINEGDLKLIFNVRQKPKNHHILKLDDF